MTEERAAPMISLSSKLREELEEQARESYPREACGLLLGHRSPRQARVLELARARNINRDGPRHRYELAPEDFRAADKAARAAGLVILGVWHSHPDGSAKPSPADLAGAWEGWSYLIAALDAEGLTELRSWRLDEAGSFRAEVLL